MRKIDKWIVILASLIFIIGLAIGLMIYLIVIKEEPKMRPTSEVKRFVKAEPISYKTIFSEASANGRLYSVSEIDLVAEASGKIITGNIPLKKGSKFYKGDILFTIYPDEAVLALKASKSKFLNSLANILPDIKIDFPEEANKFTDFFSSIELDKKLPSFPHIEDQKLKIFLASKNLLSEYYSILKGELQLSRHTIRAPFNGTYIQVNMEVGAYTNIGGRVARAIRTDLLELEVPLDRFDADWVKIGDNVTVHSEKRSVEIQGTVVRKNQFIDENTQSQGIYIRIKNNNDLNFLVGEYMVAQFPGHPIYNAMEVPRNVVFNTNEVFIVIEGRLKKKNINIIKINSNTLVFNGLPEGDTLVMQPLINVLEGTLVEIQGKQAKSEDKRKPEENIEGKE